MGARANAQERSVTPVTRSRYVGVTPSIPRHDRVSGFSVTWGLCGRVTPVTPVTRRYVWARNGHFRCAPKYWPPVIVSQIHRSKRWISPLAIRLSPSRLMAWRMALSSMPCPRIAR